MTEQIFYKRYPDIYVGAVLKDTYTIKEINPAQGKVLLEYDKMGKSITKWILACEIKSLTTFKTSQNLVGQSFGEWDIIEDGLRTKGGLARVKVVNRKTKYERVIPRANALKLLSGNATNHKRDCAWKICGDYVIGKCTNTGLIFYLDYEDYLKVKDLPLCSHTVKGGQPYLAYRCVGEEGITTNTSLVKLFELPYWTRFNNGNRFDFRKSNIDTTYRERCNIRNMIPGVWYSPSSKSWKAVINLKYRGGDIITLKTSKDLGECIKARLEAEKKYFNKYEGAAKGVAWRQELYDAWGI